MKLSKSMLQQMVNLDMEKEQYAITRSNETNDSQMKMYQQGLAQAYKESYRRLEILMKEITD